MNLKDNVDKLILNTYDICGIFAFPFDCKMVLNKHGYKCKPYSTLNSKKKNICLNISNDACIIDKTIFYNDASPDLRIRFTLMHELGHILLNHDHSSPDQEDEADYFASCILAPRIMIHHLCLTSKYQKITAKDIHDYFDISYEAANRALFDYKKWYLNIAHTTRKPTDSELQIRNIFTTTRNSERLVAEAASPYYCNPVNNKATARKKNIRQLQEREQRRIYLESHGYRHTPDLLSNLDNYTW